MRLVEQGEIQIPYGLIWRLLFHQQFEQAAKKLRRKELDALIGDYNLFEATERLIERYGVPEDYFEIQKNHDTPPKKTRRKAWTKMRRDLAIYRAGLLGKTIVAIDRSIQKDFGEELDYGNIKKIESNVRRGKLGVGKQIRVGSLKTSRGKRRTTKRLEHGGLS